MSRRLQKQTPSVCGELHFRFGNRESSVIIRENLPCIEEILAKKDALSGKRPGPADGVLLVCDENTLPLARRLDCERLVLEAGEEKKAWPAVERILCAARKMGLGRDGLFTALGGGVVCDLTAFAASVYMRGAELLLIPTSLLCMADASLGGKTGFCLGGIKNLAGTFYPARLIVIAGECLLSLPRGEGKSGMAEIIKTAVLDRDSVFFDLLKDGPPVSAQDGSSGPENIPDILSLVEKALTVKGRIVESDFRETGNARALLNLGHTFGHALESALGLGKIRHGEAVAWGMARSCELGMELGITPPERAAGINAALKAWGFETAVPYPLPHRGTAFREALFSDKKKAGGALRFVVPAEKGARLVPGAFEAHLERLIGKMP